MISIQKFVPAKDVLRDSIPSRRYHIGYETLFISCYTNRRSINNHAVSTKDCPLERSLWGWEQDAAAIVAITSIACEIVDLPLGSERHIRPSSILGPKLSSYIWVIYSYHIVQSCPACEPADVPLPTTALSIIVVKAFCERLQCQG